MTISMVPGQVIQEQGTNDLVGALQNVPGVYAFTNYGIYEGYTFRGFLDLFPSLANQLLDGVRLPRQGDRWNSVSASAWPAGACSSIPPSSTSVRENVAFSRPGGFFDQASDVTSNGFEADVTTSPVSNWRINGGYGFTDVTFGDYLVNATTNLRGNTSIMAPRHTFSVWTAYDWANGFGINVGARAQSKVFIDRANTLTFDGYGLLNVGARYRRGSVEYALNVNNLTDTEYFASVLYDTQLYPGEPINVLGTVRIRFR